MSGGEYDSLGANCVSLRVRLSGDVSQLPRRDSLLSQAKNPLRIRKNPLPASKSVPIEFGPSFIKLSLNLDMSLEKSVTWS